MEKEPDDQSIENLETQANLTITNIYYFKSSKNPFIACFSKYRYYYKVFDSKNKFYKYLRENGYFRFLNKKISPPDIR